MSCTQVRSDIARLTCPTIQDELAAAAFVAIGVAVEAGLLKFHCVASSGCVHDAV
jgi:hypothetical protein